MTRWPALVVTSGPQEGQVFTLRAERATIGRDTDSDISLDSLSVSRRHLQVSRQGLDLVVQDLGSSNGTFVNGRPLEGPSRLRPGDRLRLADVELEYVVLGAGTGATAAPASHAYEFGDVHGPVSTGHPVNQSGSQIVGRGSIYHGSVHHGDRIDLDNGLQELFSGQGPGRVLMAIGLTVAMVGFGIFMSVILSFPTDGGPDVNPFEREIFGFKAIAVGFVLFAAGGLVAQVGAGMSKAARQRHDWRDR